MFFQIDSSRYEHASLILTSNLVFSRRAELVGDATVASAMIDRIVYHAEVINLTGNNHRFHGRFNLHALCSMSAPARVAHNQVDTEGNHIEWPYFRLALKIDFK